MELGRPWIHVAEGYCHGDGADHQDSTGSCSRGSAQLRFGTIERSQQGEGMPAVLGPCLV